MEIKTFNETLDLQIETDPTTGLPLLSQQDKILQLILTYLPLPYSIVEYGCGKKCSIVIRQLTDLGIPAFSIKRGMIMERDMSDKALNEFDYTQRKHALVLENALYHRVDFDDQALIDMLDNEYVELDIDRSLIKTGNYVLENEKQIQFVKARSHIFPIITLWDEDNYKAVERVIDPTANPDELFEVWKLREDLHAPDALIFTAPLFGSFRLNKRYLTREQQKEVASYIGKQTLDQLGAEENYELTRKMNGASKGTIGDPETWTYANNMEEDEKSVEHHIRQRQITGKGQGMRELFKQMLLAREEKRSEDALKLRDTLEAYQKEFPLSQYIQEDAEWSEKELEPLAVVTNTVSYHAAICELADKLKSGESLYEFLTDEEELQIMHGLGVLLRQRIEKLAKVSRNAAGEIEAMALNENFFQATLETIRQMNKSRMGVFIDKVGNIHGILLGEATKSKIRRGELDIKPITEKALCHCSHIDTVKDAGKYDGRLGVLSGIEVAQILFDLHKYYGFDTRYPKTDNAMMVSAFIGEEMTFTGEDVSMPGSAAVAGFTTPEKVHAMKNGNNETFKDKFVEMLQFLKQHQEDGSIRLMNNFAFKEGEDLLSACFEPTDFFTKHTYERHIEQGPVLDRKEVPLVLVDTIMGIHQEDFYISGEHAEAAALEFNLDLRKLTFKEEFDNTRITVGIMEIIEQSNEPQPVEFAMRWTLFGQKNHAGATLTEDRRDPGVAAGKLVNRFIELVEEINKEKKIKMKPVIGAVDLMPGTNRNVIPSDATVTLAIENQEVPEDIKIRLIQVLQGYIVGTLSRSVSDEGEGIVSCKVSRVDYINRPSAVRLSIDLRSNGEEKINRFREEINSLLKGINKKYAVSVETSVEQELPPYILKETGQVLQIERSYGGSHNANEAELAQDVLRGTLLQFFVSFDVVRNSEIDALNLYKFVNKKLPKSWSERLDQFTSGALHDTCNIASKARLMEKKEA